MYFKVSYIYKRNSLTTTLRSTWESLSKPC